MALRSGRTAPKWFQRFTFSGLPSIFATGVNLDHVSLQLVFIDVNDRLGSERTAVLQAASRIVARRVYTCFWLTGSGSLAQARSCSRRAASTRWTSIRRIGTPSSRRVSLSRGGRIRPGCFRFQGRAGHHRRPHDRFLQSDSHSAVRGFAELFHLSQPGYHVVRLTGHRFCQ